MKTGGTSEMQIKVEGYSGFKLNERPVRFHLGGNEYAVEQILDQWYGPEANYFKVRAGDGNDYILKYHEQSDEWTLESYRRPADVEQKDVYLIFGNPFKIEIRGNSKTQSIPKSEFCAYEIRHCRNGGAHRSR